MKPIYLCGFMGCGKSHIGRVLAVKSCAVFIDLDRYIVQQQGMKIPEIFEKYGEPYFRELEAEYIKRFRGRTVIATGGGALLRDKTAEFARENGYVVFLNTDFETCYERIKGDKNRPLAVSSTKEQLNRLYDMRFPIYRKNSTFEVAANGSDRQIADTILSLIEQAEQKEKKKKILNN